VALQGLAKNKFDITILKILFNLLKKVENQKQENAYEQ
jgi:hypothetical protein